MANALGVDCGWYHRRRAGSDVVLNYLGIIYIIRLTPAIEVCCLMKEQTESLGGKILKGHGPVLMAYDADSDYAKTKRGSTIGLWGGGLAMFAGAAVSLVVQSAAMYMAVYDGNRNYR